MVSQRPQGGVLSMPNGSKAEVVQTGQRAHAWTEFERNTYKNNDGQRGDGRNQAERGEHTKPFYTGPEAVTRLVRGREGLPSAIRPAKRIL